MKVQMRAHRWDMYTQNIRNSCTRSHLSEEENRTRNRSRDCKCELSLLSFQLKCSSNIDSINYLRLTNSFHQVPRDIHTLPVKEPIPSI